MYISNLGFILILTIAAIVYVLLDMQVLKKYKQRTRKNEEIYIINGKIIKENTFFFKIQKECFDNINF